MPTRVNLAVILGCSLLLLMVACGSDDPPTAPGNGGGGGGDPTITAISPPGAGPGVQAKISGTNFGANKRAGTVVIASRSAEIVSWSDTAIEFIVPTGVTTDALVSFAVTTAGGKSVSSEIDITPPNTYRVTTDIASDHYPCWSPGGDYIFFSSTRGGPANWDLYRIPASGGEAQRLTTYEGPDFYPDVRMSSGEVLWSSTENHLGGNPDGDHEIFKGYLVAVQGGAVTKGMFTQNESRDLDPTWSPTVYGGFDKAATWELVDVNGSFVAWRIMLYGTGGNNDRTEGRQPNFSPDGQWVVYNLDENIYKIGVTGGDPLQLTDHGNDWYPHWGANDKIAFQRYDSGSYDIYTMNPDGTDLQPLLNAGYHEYNPTWSPDGSMMVYHAHRWSNYDIYVYVVP